MSRTLAQGSRRRIPQAIAVLLALCLPFLIPLGAAQGEESAAAEIDDDSDDVTLYVAGQAQPAPAGYFDHVDITTAWIGKETDTTVEAGVTFKVMNPTTPAPIFRRGFSLSFTRGGEGSEHAVAYRLQTFGRGCEPGMAGLLAYDAGAQAFRSVKCVPLTVDDSTATYRFILDKNDLVDRRHIPLGFNDVLTNFVAFATNWLAPGTGGGGGGFNFIPVPVASTAASDRAPDTGLGPTFKSVLGVAGAGHLHLDSPEPVRVSNGEATTIVFPARLHNGGTDSDDALLEVTENSGKEWQIRVPPRLSVAPDEVVDFPVILTMPMNHLHGETWTFTVRASSSRLADSWTEQEFGVFFTEVPQPSEHHNGLLYLHSGDAESGDDTFSTAFTTLYEFRRTWMNPERDDPDPAATDEPVPAYFNEALFDFPPSGAPQNVARWDFALSPALLIGLDFDTTQPVLFSTRIVHPLPAQQAHVHVALLYCENNQNANNSFIQCDEDEATVLAAGDTAATALQANSDTQFSQVQLEVQPEADLIPYQRGANLHLVVQLYSDLPQNAITPEPKPLLYPAESEMTLPLREYHDPVEQAFQRVGTLQLTAEGVTEKLVNPGRTAVFPLAVANTGSEAAQVQLEAVGTNNQWAKFAELSPLKLAPGESRSIHLMITVPEGTPPDVRADLFAVAQSASDPNVAAVVRVRAISVDPAVQVIPDEAGQVQVETPASTPGLAAWMVLGAIGAALAPRRRVR